jgi:ketosteroid isomerase-like protein
VPRADVDVVLDQFAATNERDFERAMSYYAEDVVLFVHPDAFLESGTFEGSQAVGAWFGKWFSTFEADYHFDIEEAREVDDAVLLVASHHGRGRTSGVEVRGETGYVYRVRDGEIVRAELYPSGDAALAAASSP